MSDWVYVILSALGLLFLGAGGGGLIFARKRGRPRVPHNAVVEIKPHRPVGPTPEEVKEADSSAKETKEKLRALQEKQKKLDAKTPVPRPTKAGVDFLNRLKEEKKL